MLIFSSRQAVSGMRRVPAFVGFEVALDGI
jgi:hypothetical protein